MIKKIQKNDCFFLIAITAGLLMHLLCIYSGDHFTDDSFYPAVALRLINGDSLVQHEWHLTQFSSLFLYLPVRIWLALKGSTDCIILFLRYLYLTIHTLAAVGVYTYFRKHGIWAVIASLLFYTQVPLRFLCISYNSMNALFLLTLTIILLMLYKKSNLFLHIFAGICYGCCCVCNPFFCAIFVAYVIFCIIWWRREKLLRNNTLKKKSKKARKNALLIEEKCELYNRFFSKKAFLWISLGISVVAIVSVVFFYATGGTISSLIENFKYLLTDPDYDYFISSGDIFIRKLRTTLFAFNEITFNMLFLFPILYIVLFFGKTSRWRLKSKIVCVSISLAMATLIVFGIATMPINANAFALSLPFAIVSHVCYILTHNKNKKLFYCMWLPGVIGTVIQYLATAITLSACYILAISNIAGVFFVRDFFAELHEKNKTVQKVNTEKNDKRLRTVCRSLLCIGLCLQLVFQCFMYSFGRIINIGEDTQVNVGPYAGLHLKEKYYDSYVPGIKDMDIIKEYSNSDDPVLIISQFNWLSLYIDRPIASYSIWMPFLNYERLNAYYESNPDKKPKFIYIGYQHVTTDMYANIIEDYEALPGFAQQQADVLKQMFNCTQVNLSSGILLIVNE